MATYFVDLSAVNNGDGSTPGQAATPGGVGAFNTLVGLIYGAGDQFWLRRVVASSPFGSDITIANTDVILIGWPVSGDDYYNTRPASGISEGWDSDVSMYATFEFTGSNIEFNVSGARCEFYRLNGMSANGDSLSVTGPDFTMKHCVWSVDTVTNSWPFVMTTTAVRMLLEHCVFNIESFTGSSPFFAAGQDFRVFRYIEVNIVDLNHSSILVRWGINNVFDNVIFNVTNLSGSVAPVFMSDTSETNLTVLGMHFNVTNDLTASDNSSANRFGDNTIAHDVRIDACSGLWVSTNSRIYVAAFSRKTSKNQLFSAGAGSEFYVNNLIGLPGDNQLIDLSSSSTAILRNFQPGPASNPVDVLNKSSVFSLDHNNIKGAWKKYVPNGTAETSTVFRVDGSTYSVLLEPISNVPHNFIHGMLGFSQPFEDSLFLSVTPGLATITLYGAYQGYINGLTNQDIWMELEYLNALNNVVLSSTRDLGNSKTMVSSDVSVWSGETGLTPFKLEITIDFSSNQIVPVRLFGLTFESFSYVYFDPKPVVS